MAPIRRGSARRSHVHQLRQVLEAHWGGPAYLALRHYAPEVLLLATDRDDAKAGAKALAGARRLAWGWGAVDEPSAAECRRFVAFVREELRRVWGLN